MTIIWIALALFLGASVAIQGTINSALATRIGTGPTLLINTSIVMLGAAAVALILSDWSRMSLKSLADVPFQYYVGGMFGFFIVFLAMILIPRLGAGLTLSLAITAQLTIGLLIDHFGIMGVPTHGLSLPRLAGVGMLIAGAMLVKYF